MRISMIDPNSPLPIFLATLEVVSDIPESWEDEGNEGDIRRTITGRIIKKSERWDEMLAIKRVSLQQRGEEGETWWVVPGLQVDHDYYSIISKYTLKGDQIRIRVFESFPHPLEEYPAALTARNQRVEAYLTGRYPIDEAPATDEQSRNVL